MSTPRSRAGRGYQDLWAHLIGRLGRFDPDRGQLKSFVVAVCHRRLVDRHRRRKIRRVSPLTDVAGGTGPEDAFVARRRADRLELALGHLPESQRRVVVAQR